MRRGWLDLLRSLGGALVEVLRAEVETLGEELQSTGRGLAIALGILGVAAAFAFWACGALTLALFEIASLWLPRWGAGLAVVGLLLVISFALLLLAKARLSRLEAPAATVRRRVEESAAWWNERVLENEPRSLAAKPEGEE